MSFSDSDILKVSNTIKRKVLAKMTSRTPWSSGSRFVVVSHSQTLRDTLASQINKRKLDEFTNFLVNGDSSLLFETSKMGYINPHVKIMLPAKKDSFRLRLDDIFACWDLTDSVLQAVLRDINSKI